MRVNTTVALASFSLLFAPVAFGEENTRDLLRKDVSKIQRLQIKMSNFLERHAVEIIRETNLIQNGQIQGSIQGGGYRVQLGNVLALAQGILGLTVNAAELALGPFAPLGAPGGLTNLSSLLTGLSGMGYGSLSLSGSLQGQFEGRGVQIHDEARLFLVLVKDEPTLDQLVESARNHVQAMEQAQKPLWQRIDTRALDIFEEAISRIKANPYIVSTAAIREFQAARDEFRRAIQSADLVISENIGEADPIYRDAQARVEIAKSWAASKRLIAATVLPAPTARVVIAERRTLEMKRGYYQTRLVNGVHVQQIAGIFDCIGGQTTCAVRLEKEHPHCWKEVPWAIDPRVPASEAFENVTLYLLPRVRIGTTVPEKVENAFDPALLQVVEERIYF